MVPNVAWGFKSFSPFKDEWGPVQDTAITLKYHVSPRERRSCCEFLHTHSVSGSKEGLASALCTVH